MDVKLSSSAVIPYLDKGSIEEYANLNFYSDKGEVVKDGNDEKILIPC